jgi:UDP-GlcNAc:undecaprenyl-phosphate GlcNAc-1-phosphate transferase
LRFESDITILAFVSAFFVLSITVMQLAARSGWRLRGESAADNSRLARIVTVIQQPKLLPRLSYLAIAFSLAGYAALIVLGTAALSNDIRVLIVALFALTISLFLILRSGPLRLLEKAVLYVTATVLVYLDAVVLPADHLVSTLTWIAVSIAAVATAVRLRLHNDRRFQVTPLDLIVLFMALVVPSLPGTFNLPHGGALTIAKLLVLFYAVEVLVSRSEGRAVWMRIAVVSVLAGLSVRPLLSF